MATCTLYTLSTNTPELLDEPMYASVVAKLETSTPPLNGKFTLEPLFIPAIISINAPQLGLSLKTNPSYPSVLNLGPVKDLDFYVIQPNFVIFAKADVQDISCTLNTLKPDPYLNIRVALNNLGSTSRLQFASTQLTDLALFPTPINNIAFLLAQADADLRVIRRLAPDSIPLRLNIADSILSESPLAVNDIPSALALSGALGVIYILNADTTQTKLNSLTATLNEESRFPLPIQNLESKLATNSVQLNGRFALPVDSINFKFDAGKPFLDEASSMFVSSPAIKMEFAAGKSTGLAVITSLSVESIKSAIEIGGKTGSELSEESPMQVNTPAVQFSAQVSGRLSGRFFLTAPSVLLKLEAPDAELNEGSILEVTDKLELRPSLSGALSGRFALPPSGFINPKLASNTPELIQQVQMPVDSIVMALNRTTPVEIYKSVNLLASGNALALAANTPDLFESLGAASATCTLSALDAPITIWNLMFVKPFVQMALSTKNKVGLNEIGLTVVLGNIIVDPIIIQLDTKPAPFMRKIVGLAEAVALEPALSISKPQLIVETALDDGIKSLYVNLAGSLGLSSILDVLKRMTANNILTALDVPVVSSEETATVGFIILVGDNLGNAVVTYKLADEGSLAVKIALAADLDSKRVTLPFALSTVGVLNVGLQPNPILAKLASPSNLELNLKAALPVATKVQIALNSNSPELYTDIILTADAIETNLFQYSVSFNLIKQLQPSTSNSALDFYGLNPSVEPELSYTEQDVILASNLNPVFCRITSTLAGFMFTPTSAEFPTRSQEIVKYPMPTGTSFAMPVTNEGIPIYMSHSAFGSAVFTVDGTNGAGEFSVRFNAALAAAAGEYVSTPSSVSNVLLLRVTSSDTAFLKRSLAGIDLIGPNVQKSANYSNLTQSSGQLLSALPGSGSGTDLAIMPASDISTFSINGTGKRLLFGSSNIRHNYSAGQPITEPTAIASDLVVAGKKYFPTRVESTVGAYIDDLSAVYSTAHFGLVNDSAVQINGSSALMSGSLMAQDGDTVGSVHSSDSCFAFMPIKTGLRLYYDTRKTRREGSFKVTSAVFDPTNPAVYVVELIDATTLAPIDIRTLIEANDKASLRLKIQNYRNQQGRVVTVDVPVIDVGDDLAGAVGVDSSYRWFFDQIKANGQFNSTATVYLLVEEASTFATGTTELFVTRPVVDISGDQGESLENLLAAGGDRNVLLGEFSISLTKPDIDASADVRISQGSASSVIYSGSTSPAAYTSTVNPRQLNIVVKADGTLYLSIDTVPVSQNSVLPQAVVDFINAGGRFSKVKVSENVIGLLTVPQSGSTQRRLYLWGNNAYGQLDVPSAVAPSFDTTWYVPNVRDFDIAAAYVTIIGDDGLLKSWGCTRSTSWVAANTVAPIVEPVKEMAVGDKVSVVKTNTNQIRSFGGYTAPSGQTWSTDYTKTLAAGERHLAAITSTGTVVCWGDNSLGQCNVPGGLTNVVEIEAGHNHTVARKSDGSVVCWGSNTFGQSTVPAGLNAKAVSAGGNFTAAIRSASSTDVNDGGIGDYIEDTIACWGQNDRGQCNVPTCEGVSYDPTSTKYRMRFKQLSCGWDHVTAVRSDSDPVKAARDHPELTRFFNMGFAKFPLKTAANAVIYQDLHDLKRCTQTACYDSTIGQYDTGQFVEFISRDGATGYTLTCDGSGNWTSATRIVGGQSYRLYSSNPYAPSLTALEVQKLVSGIWRTLYFEQTVVDTNDSFFGNADDEFTQYGPGILRYYAMWDGHKTGSLILPTWKVGYRSNDVSTAPNQVAYIGSAYLDSGGSTLSGEYVSIDFTALDAIGLVNYDNRLVHWGNPIAYDIAYRKDDYEQYGIDVANLEDFVSIQRAGYPSTLPYQTGTLETTSYVGFGADFADYDTNNYWFYEGANPRMYLGAYSLFEVPLDKKYDYTFSNNITRTVGVPTIYIGNTYWNRPLPVSASTVYTYGTPSGAGYSAPLDSYPDDKPSTGFLNNCVVVRSTTSIPSGASIVIDATSPSGRSVSWTGTVFGNTITVNLTAAYAIQNPQSGNYEIYAPFDSTYSNQPLSLDLVTLIGLSVKLIYAVRHISDEVLQPNQVIKSGKHISWLRKNPSPGFTAFNYEAVGMVQRSTDALTADRSLTNFSAHNAFFGYRTYTSIELSPFLTYSSPAFVYYRLLYADYGGINTGQLDISREFKFGARNFAGFDDISYVYPPSFFMNFGQTSVPSPQTTSEFVDISCSQFHSVALDNLGSVYAWGCNNRVEPAKDFTGEWTPAKWHYWPVEPTQEQLNNSPTNGQGIAAYYTSANGANILANTVSYNSRAGSLEDIGTSSRILYYPDEASAPGFGDVSSWDISGVFLSIDTSATKVLFHQPYSVSQPSPAQVQTVNISLVVENSVKRLKVSTNAPVDDKTSDPIPANARFITAWWDYTDAGVVLKAVVNGTPVTWSGADNSGVFTKIDPKSCLGVFGGGSSYETFKRGLHVRNVADRTVTKLFAGDYVNGMLLQNAVDPTRSDIEAKYATGAPRLYDVNEPVFDVSANNNQYVASVKRTYESIDTSTAAPIAGTIYAGSTIAVIRYDKANPNFKIAVPGLAAGDYHQVDFNTTSIFFPGLELWPRIVFPAGYSSESWLASPEHVYITKLPRFTYTADQFSILCNDVAAAVQTSEYLDYDPNRFVPVVGTTEISEYVFYDQTTGKILPQSVVNKLLPPGLNVQKFAAGSNFTYALRATDGKLTGWGRHGQDDQNSISHDPNKVYVDVVAHDSLVAAITSLERKVEIWGAGLSSTGRGLLVDPSGAAITNVKKVAVGTIPGSPRSLVAYIDVNDRLKVLAMDGLNPDGTIITRTINPSSPNENQLENPYPNDAFQDIKSGYHCFVGLRSNGSVVAWGYNSNVVNGAPTPVGDVYPAGLIPNSNQTGFVQIAVGYQHAAARRADGTLAIWGLMYTVGRLNSISGGTTYSDVACGREHIYVIRQVTNRIYGMAWADGSGGYLNTYGELNFPALQTAQRLAQTGALAGHSVYIDAGGTLRAIGAGEQGEQGTLDWGQSAVPYPSVPTEATFNPVGSSTQDFKNVLSSLTPPPSLAALPSGTVPAATLALKRHAISIAAGTNYCVAVQGDTYAATQGSLVSWGTSIGTLPTGSNFVKVACRNRHAVAIRADGTAITWGNNANGQAPGAISGNFIDAVCTDTSTILLTASGLVQSYGAITSPGPYSTVTFSKIAGGSNHVIATVSQSAVVFLNGQITFLQPNQIVGWGANDSTQATPPGYAPLQYGAPATDHIAAGLNFSSYYRNPQGFVVPSEATSIAMLNVRGYDELLEGYTVFKEGRVCEGLLPQTHPFLFSAPRYRLDPNTNVGINSDGYDRDTSWLTNATNVPAAYRPGGGGAAKRIGSGRLRQFIRTGGTFESSYEFGIGYGVLVDANNQVVVWGGEQTRTGPCSLPPLDATIALKSVPTLAPDENVLSIDTALGYIYMLKDDGSVVSWGYNHTTDPNYFQIAAGLKQMLSVPTVGINDSLPSYNGQNIGLTYVSGLPNQTTAWAIDVYVDRVFNGQSTNVRRFTAVGDVRIRSLTQPVHFAQTFMGSDVWPGSAVDLDSYYRMYVVGRGLSYKINTASLLVMNMDSRISPAQRVFVDGDQPGTGQVDMFLRSGSGVAAFAGAQEVASNIAITSIQETETGIRLGYIGDAEYPGYLIVQSGQTAEIESIDGSGSVMTVAGRIANLQTRILSEIPNIYVWFDSVSLPTVGTASVASWTNAISGMPALVKGSNAFNDPLCASIGVSKGLTLDRGAQGGIAAADFMLASYPNIAIGEFTYFLVAHKTAAAITSPYMAFGASAGAAGSVPARIQGLGYASGIPGVFFFDSTIQQTRYVPATTAVTLNQKHVICGYYGGSSSVSVRVNGIQQTMGTSVAQTVTLGGSIESTTGFNLGTGVANSVYHDALDTYIEVVAFNRKLTDIEILFVERYLADKHGVTLPAEHPLNSPLDKSVCVTYPGFTGFHSTVIESNRAATANGLKQTWLALFDYGVTHNSARLNGQNEHAPILADIEIALSSTLTMLASPVVMKLAAASAVNGLDAVSGDLLAPNPIRTTLSLLPAPELGKESGIRLLTSGVRMKLSGSGPLGIIRNLTANTSSSLLQFFGGENCDTPYGCTDVSIYPPYLNILNFGFNALPLASYMNINPSSMAVLATFKLIDPIALAQSVVTAKLGGTLDLYAGADIRARRAVAPRMKLLAANANLGYSTSGLTPNAIYMQSDVSICDYTKFVITNPTAPYTPPTNPFKPTPPMQKIEQPPDPGLTAE